MFGCFRPSASQQKAKYQVAFEQQKSAADSPTLTASSSAAPSFQHAIVSPNPSRRKSLSARRRSISSDSSSLALTFHILAESPSIISVFSGSPNGRSIYQNVKSLEYYGDLSKVETHSGDSHYHQILKSLLSFEQSDDKIDVRTVLSELDVTGSWVGSIKVPQRLHFDPDDVSLGELVPHNEVTDLAGHQEAGYMRSERLPARIDEDSDYLGGVDPAISAPLALDQALDQVSPSFRKAPTRVKILLRPSFQSMLPRTNGASMNGSTGSLRSADPTNGSLQTPTKSVQAESISRASPEESDDRDMISSSLLALMNGSIEDDAPKAGSDAELPQSDVARPSQLPSPGQALKGNRSFWHDVEQDRMTNTLANGNASNPNGTHFEWHDLSIKKLEHPVTGEPLILVTQNDVTVRVAMERAMVTCANTQLNMILTIFPLHVVEFFNQQRDPKGSARDVAEPDIGQLARSHKDVTILFMDIVGFTSMSKEVPPAVVMKFLNDLFGRFDHLLEEHKVQKVETAGDCYIVAAGVVTSGADGFSEVLSSHDPHLSAARVLAFAQSMLQHSKTMRMPHNGEPVLVRIGIHTGDCVSGLVGSTLHKFGLFGDTMNTASRMESTSVPGRIQISASTYEMLPPDLMAQFEATGGVEVKGKGRMETHFWMEPSAQSTSLHQGSTQSPGMDLNVFLGGRSSDLLDRTRKLSAGQSLFALYESADSEDIMKSQSKIVGAQKRPAFEAMTQACHDAVTLLHSLASDSKSNKRSSSVMHKIPSNFISKLSKQATPLGPTSQDDTKVPSQASRERRPVRKSMSMTGFSFPNHNKPELVPEISIGS